MTRTRSCASPRRERTHATAPSVTPARSASVGCISQNGSGSASSNAGDFPVLVIVCHWPASRPVGKARNTCRNSTTTSRSAAWPTVNSSGLSAQAWLATVLTTNTRLRIARTSAGPPVNVRPVC